jgi:hypothetical protein
MKPHFHFLAILACVFAPPAAPAAEAPPAAKAEGPSVVKIVKTDKGYQMLRNGQPYFAKGVCGGSRLDELAAAGGNSIRTYGGANLDQPHRRGLTALVGLGLRPMRQGFDYGDPQAVAAQADRIRQNVLKLKDHPALLMWALGNELELSVARADRVKIWKALNQFAEVVKQADGNHPVIAVLAGLGDDKLRELNENCPALDAVGINTYGGGCGPARLDAPLAGHRVRPPRPLGSAQDALEAPPRR